MSYLTTRVNQQPRSGDGRDLCFVGDNRMLYAVDICGGPSVEYGSPRELFHVRVDVGPGTLRNVVPSRDGQRCLVNQRVAGAADPPINVVLNWQAELEK